MYRGRLAEFSRMANEEFWDEHWREYLSSDPKRMRLSSKGYLLNVVRSRLSKGAFIVEGGCGTGKNVVALARMGYRVIGIDFAPRTVQFLRRNFPSYWWVQGDVRSLAFSDGTADGYLSIGVVEHLQEGPDAVLREIARVVKPGGMLFLTVPSRNVIRDLKVVLGFYPGRGEQDAAKERFYQYYFSRKEMKALLQTHGFQVERAVWQSSLKLLKDEISFLRSALSYIANPRRVTLFTKAVGKGIQVLSRPFFGHTCLYICRRSGAN